MAIIAPAEPAIKACIFNLDISELGNSGGCIILWGSCNQRHGRDDDGNEEMHLYALAIAIMTMRRQYPI